MAKVISTNTQKVEEESDPKETVFRVNSLLQRTNLGSLYVSGKLLTHPSPKQTFCPKWEVSVNVGLGEG